MFNAAQRTEPSRRKEMKQVYVITKIENNRTFAMQEKHLEGHISKAHASLEVINPRKIKIHEGSKVYIGLPQKAEAVRGILCLFMPLIMCGAALLCAPFIACLLHVTPSETFKFICITAAFVVSTAAVTFFSRNTETIVKLQVLSLAEK